MTRTRTVMSVGEILRRATGSTDIAGEIDWWRILAAKVSHDHFDWLADKIAEEGFTLPIVLHPDDNGGYTIGNGHHRLCAAILLGLDEIPVVIAPYFDWVADSHDGDMELPPASFDYWGLLAENMEGNHCGDESGMAWRAQYRGQEDEEYGSPEIYRCEECGDCETCCAGRARYCDYCGEWIDRHGDQADHMIACPEREYEYIACVEFGEGHYRWQACEACRTEDHEHAMREHVARGFLPFGAWHPAGVLAEAYAEHEERERQRAIYLAGEEATKRLRELREAQQDGAGMYRMAQLARAYADAWDAYMAL